MTNRYRPRSPPGHRSYHDPRASTGFISTSFEPAYPSYPRSAIDPYSTRHGSIYEPPAPKRYPYQGDSYGGTVSRTEYPVSAYNRPRNNSTLSAEGRRPLSMIAKNTSPPRYKPVVSNVPRDAPRSPPLGPSNGRGEPSRYLIPARTGGSEHHQRHYSANRAEADRFIPAARGSRRGEYHQSGGYESSKGYGGARGVKDDDFSYTGPREQFDRDYPVRSSQSRDQRDPYVRRERPVSVMELPEHKAPPVRRDMGPPPPRQAERLEPVRRSGLDSDPDRSADLPQRRHSMRAPVVHQQRDDNYGPPRDEFDRTAPKARRDRLDDDDAAAIKLRQRELDAQYEREKIQRREREKDHDREKEREHLRERDLRERDRDRDRDRDREREREKPRDKDRDRERERDKDRERERPRPHQHEKSRRAEDDHAADASPERSGIAKAAAAGLAGAGATAVANAVLKSKKPDEASDSDERKERRRRHHRHHEHDEVEDQRGAEPLRERRTKEAVAPIDDRGQYDSGYGTSKRGEDSSESHEDDSGKRRHRRSRRHEAREDESVPDQRLAPPDPYGERELSPGDDDSSHRHRRSKSRDKSRTREAGAADRDAEHRTLSPGENEDDRPRRVQLVEPVDKREEVKPKGILKPSRTTPFPEDPNPTREGVAPLKDAGKQGIPVGARWTKISRMLVNPEALERAHERFEERDEYVIVLRVLSREEIAKFAEKTQEIRAERERLWKDEVERRGLGDHHAAIEPRSVDSIHEGDEAEPRTAAIEARPPATAGNDVQTLLDPSVQEMDPNALPGAVPVPDIKLEDTTNNYSTNV